MKYSKSALYVLLVSASLLMVGLSVAPTASAHPCSAEDPQFECGGCDDDIQDHDHTYTDGSTYCESEGCGTDVVCIILRYIP